MLTLEQVTLLVGGIIALFAAAAFLVSLLHLRSAIAFALATNVVAWSLVVACSFALSIDGAVRRSTTWAWVLLALALAGACWIVARRPPLPGRASVAALSVVLRADRLARFLALVVGGGFAYVVALSVATPENEGDALSYHVARAAFWYQDHRIAYIGNAIETRLNVNPPNAEIGDLFTMLLSGTQRFVGLVQIGALVICVLAAAGIARRIGATHAAALWAGLLVATLPVVITQSWTAQNDLVVAAFLATAGFFVLGNQSSEHILAGLATALAIGTKFTAVISLPLLLIVVAASPAPGRVRRVAWLLGIGGAGGSIWYLVNLAHTGHWDGGLAQGAHQTPSGAASVLGTIWRFGLDSLDLSGLPYGSGPIAIDWLLFPAAGLVLLLLFPASGLGLLWYARRRHRLRDGEQAWRTYAACALVVALPSLVGIAYLGLFAVGNSGSRTSVGSTPNTFAGATPSWFGPLGVFLALVGIAAGVSEFRRMRVSRQVLPLAFAPVILLISVAALVVWDPWRGRFLIFAYVLAAASWSLILRHRWLARAITLVAAITMVMALVNAQSKPSGLWPLQAEHAASVWGKPRWWVETVLRSEDDDRTVLRFAERQIPAHSILAVAPRGNDFLSPFFGPDLTRRVELVRSGGVVSPKANWIVAAPGVNPTICAKDWQTLRRTSSGWRILRRVMTDRGCAVLKKNGGGRIRTSVG